MKFALPCIKFSFPLSELLESYIAHENRNQVYLCEFVKQNFLPQKSILHKIYLCLARPNSSLIDNLTQQFNAPDAYVLELAFKDHKDFKDIPVGLSISKYRIEVMQRMLQLKPDMIITVKY